MNKSRLNTPKHFTIPLSADLYRLVLLKDGWDGGDAKAITREALIALGNVKVVPTVEGGVSLELSTSSDNYNINFYADGHVSVVQS